MHVFRLQIITVVSDEMTAYNEIRRNLVLGNSVNENQLIYSRTRKYGLRRTVLSIVLPTVPVAMNSSVFL